MLSQCEYSPMMKMTWAQRRQFRSHPSAQGNQKIEISNKEKDTHTHTKQQIKSIQPQFQNNKQNQKERKKERKKEGRKEGKKEKQDGDV